MAQGLAIQASWVLITWGRHTSCESAAWDITRPSAAKAEFSAIEDIRVALLAGMRECAGRNLEYYRQPARRR
jgi:hypothetical protein